MATKKKAKQQPTAPAGFDHPAEKAPAGFDRPTEKSPAGFDHPTEKAPAGFGPTERTSAVFGPKGAPTVFGPTEDDIRKRAYEIYLARKGGPGNEFDDWVRAEAELRQVRRAS